MFGKLDVVAPVAPTGLLPRPGDSFVSGARRPPPPLTPSRPACRAYTPVSMRVACAPSRSRSLVRLCAMQAKRCCIRPPSPGAALACSRWCAEARVHLIPADAQAPLSMCCCADVGASSRPNHLGRAQHRPGRRGRRRHARQQHRKRHGRRHLLAPVPPRRHCRHSLDQVRVRCLPRRGQPRSAALWPPNDHVTSAPCVRSLSSKMPFENRAPTAPSRPLAEHACGLARAACAVRPHSRAHNLDCCGAQTEFLSLCSSGVLSARSPSRCVSTTHHPPFCTHTHTQHARAVRGQIYAFSATTSTLSASHNARVLFLLCYLSESLGIAFVRAHSALEHAHGPP